MTSCLLLYGATGYTGRLIARAAKAAALSFILAGRDERKLRMVAASLGFPHRTAPLEDASRLHAMLHDVDVVLNVAGPFSRTARPLVDVCLQRSIHYLDVAGELSVFTALFQRDAEARARHSMVMPGIGHTHIPPAEPGV